VAICWYFFPSTSPFVEMVTKCRPALKWIGSEFVPLIATSWRSHNFTPSTSARARF